MFIEKNRPRTTVAEPIGETLAELPFTGDQAVCLGHDQAAWSGPASTRGPLITAILNKKVYEDTVSACGLDGSGGLNATNIGDPAYKEAPVCAAFRDKTLFPGADLYSDFSSILISTKGVTSASCPTEGGANLYAGCMTAPCTNTGKTDPSTGLPLVKCTCPTYNGPNQVGNPQINSYSCSPTPHVWSSAYSAPNPIPTDP